ncbi:MAG: hypothetical protein ACJ8NR_10710 [Sulfurifustis sp.]
MNEIDALSAEDAAILAALPSPAHAKRAPLGGYHDRIQLLHAIPGGLSSTQPSCFADTPCRIKAVDFRYGQRLLSRNAPLGKPHDANRSVVPSCALRDRGLSETIKLEALN